MSADNVIEVNNVSKFFEIYRKPSHRLWQMISRGRRQFYEPFWALRDISFSMGRGECLGIIGRNGAGKSTLLQIIAGTLNPSSGSAIVRGRVGALLELGSGFNPEFTGRENMRLNAAIMGLSDDEIGAREEAIAAFADIGDFIDQPIKSYSSGMVVRLAFAVMAHIDAEVLIIDEALAVGDTFFTQKCMRFLRRFMEDHSVLFVSHDVASVNSLCNRAILLENGAIKMAGQPKEVTRLYLKDLYESQQGESAPDPAPARAEEESAPDMQDYRDMRADLFNGSTLRNDIKVFAFNPESDSFGLGGASITGAWLLDSQGRPLQWIVGGEPVSLRVVIRANTDIYSPIVGFEVKNRFGQTVFGDNTFITYREDPLTLAAGSEAEAIFSFVMPILERGDYTIAIAVAEGTQDEHVQHDWKHEAILVQSITSSCHTGMVGIPMRRISLKTM